VGGELQPTGTRLRPEDTEAAVAELLSETQLEQLRTTGEVDGSFGLPGVSRFRLNVYRQRSCLALAIRVIPSTVPTLEEMGLPNVLKDLCQHRQGLILVTGPTGSGKSTTLAAMIHHINTTARRHIVTLENPIEYLHNHAASLVNQREVGFDTLSFELGLRAALRQDPDVILVGEMRDTETIRTVITAAETGHLVLATVHTLSAGATIERVVDVFPAAQQAQVRGQLATALVGVVSQRLFRRAKGRGRIAAIETMINTPAIANLIRQGKLHQLASMLQAGRSQGMVTMRAAVEALLKAGTIRREDALPYLGSGY
jgi:twitching motility protein PilT